MLKYRKKPYKEGVLKEIYSYFIKPIIQAKPAGVNMHDYLDKIFCVEERSITRYTAKREFKLPGLLWMAPHKLAPGIGERIVKPDSEVWVRRDITMPDRIDIEVFNGVGQKNQIFALNRNEFDTVSKHLEVWPFRKNKRVKFSWEKP